MVCIQCYLPPIMFMIYMKLIHPLISPILGPIFGRIATRLGIAHYFDTNAACPIRRPPSNITSDGSKDEAGDPGSKATTSSDTHKKVD